MCVLFFWFYMMSRFLFCVCVCVRLFCGLLSSHPHLSMNMKRWWSLNSILDPSTTAVVGIISNSHVHSNEEKEDGGGGGGDNGNDHVEPEDQCSVWRRKLRGL